METTAEKLLCDSTICLQQIAAATQKLYWILLCLVLIEFALEKLFFKKKKKFQIHKYSYFSIKGKISWQHILRAGVCFWAFWGWKTLSNLSHGVFLNAATKKHPKAEYSPHLSLNKGVFFRAAKLTETCSLSNFSNMRRVVFVSKKRVKKRIPYVLLSCLLRPACSKSHHTLNSGV